MSQSGFNVAAVTPAGPMAAGLQQVLDDATQRLTRRLNPLRNFLFGSAARGTMSRDIDLDFLVVVPEGSDCRQLMVEAHRELRDLALPKDVLVTTPSRLEAARHDFASVLFDVLRDGKVVYERGT